MDFIFDPSLVLYLPLYELDGVSFVSKDGYGHLGTATGAVWRPKGRYFDGADDYINCGNGVNIASLTGDFTIIFWCKPDDITRADETPIGTRYGKNDFTRPYDFQRYANQQGFVMGTGTGQILTQSSVIAQDMYYHCAGKIEGDAISLFINGKLDGTNTFSGTRQTGTRFVIGAADTVAVRDFLGLVGEVRIYSRALSCLEIQQDYLATKWRYQ